ncbi:DUF6417 family protein [Streptomyces sp. NPDC001156]
MRRRGRWRLARPEEVRDDVVCLLVTVAQAGGPMSGEAGRLAWEIASPIPRRADHIAHLHRIHGAAPGSRVRP